MVDRGVKQAISGTTMRGLAVASIAALCAPGLSSTAAAQRIENTTAVFAALDKVTARISRLEVKLGETAKFGGLKVSPKSCYTRAPTEPPKTSSFVEVSETQLDGQEKKIFSGWMFAESPGLNAVEHPVFDVWLTECTGARTPPPAASAAAKGATTPRQGAPQGSAPQPAQGQWQNTPAAGQPGQPVEGDLRRRPPR